MMSVELRHLRAFVAVAQELHFGRAAARLHIVQPALSAQIRGLEDMLGVKLLNRTKRMVALTEPGRLFLAEATRTLQQADRSFETARRADRGEVGRLAIGFSGAAAYTGLLARLLRNFHRAAPEVELSFRDRHPAQLRQALLAEELDIALVASHTPYGPALLAGRLVESWPLALAIPETHRLAAFASIPLDQLRGESFVSYAAFGEDLGIDALRRAADFEPHVVHHAENPVMLLSLISAELGIALVPAILQQSCVAGIAFRPLTEALPAVPVMALYRRDHATPVLARFLDSIQTTCALTN